MCEKIGLTYVHIATLIQNSDALSAFLTGKFESNAHDNNGKTPLDYALQLNNPEIVNLLKRHGAKTSAFHEQKENRKPTFKLSDKKITIIDCTHFLNRTVLNRTGIVGISRSLNADDIGKRITRPAPSKRFDWSDVPHCPSEEAANLDCNSRLLLGIAGSTLLVWEKILGISKMQDLGDWLPSDEYSRFVNTYKLHQFKHISCNCDSYWNKENLRKPKIEGPYASKY